MAGSFTALRRSRSAAQRNTRKPTDNSGSDSSVSGANDSGAGIDGGNAIDPETAIAAGSGGNDGDAGTDNGSAEPRRKRGRPPGSGNKAKASGSPVITGGIEKTLLSIHRMGAAFFSAPEWELQESEAKSLAAAISEVEKHYKIPGMSEERAAILGLVLVAGSIYAPRIILTATKRKRKNSPSPTQRQEEPQIFNNVAPDSNAFKPSFMN